MDFWACRLFMVPGRCRGTDKGGEDMLYIIKRSPSLVTVRVLHVCYEAANTLNKQPLGRIPDEGSGVTIPTPNSLLLGGSTTSILDSSQLDIQSSKSRLGLANQVSEKFWEKWVELFVSTMIRESKLKKEGRNFEVGDIVVVSDSNILLVLYAIAEVFRAQSRQ